MQGANLRSAMLREADLSGANLTNAQLQGADKVTGLTQEQLASAILDKTTESPDGLRDS
jgi:uncharacterized protein YjbI with pentapeptide repeats